MTEFPVSSGCQCGAVRYTMMGPAKSVEHCHCSICRKVHAAMTCTGAVADADKLRIDKGEENLTAYRSSETCQRLFCKTCGSQLFFRVDGFSDETYFMPATLDGGVHPGHPRETECHIYVDSKAEWDEIADGLPQFPERSEWSRF